MCCKVDKDNYNWCTVHQRWISQCWMSNVIKSILKKEKEIGKRS